MGQAAWLHVGGKLLPTIKATILGQSMACFKFILLACLGFGGGLFGLAIGLCKLGLTSDLGDGIRAQ